ncbi:MAG: UDP-N-acetylmuramate dehydrogenase [Myxococcales bacterium]|nr:UDP-N-acetylmuramate dehydrogenase [Myxococcales bacterium]
MRLRLPRRRLRRPLRARARRRGLGSVGRFCRLRGRGRVRGPGGLPARLPGRGTGLRGRSVKAAPGFVASDVPLGPRTTLGVGGAARWLAAVEDEAQLDAALAWARGARLPVFVLGGGSNVLVSDAGFDGLVVQVAACGRAVRRVDDAMEVDVAAGEVWDALVEWSVAEGLAGIECLSGIPGAVGAAPIQNIGAYGQEVGTTLVSVRAVDVATGAARDLAADACALGYRTSRFKADPRRVVLTQVTLRLRPGGAPTVAYADLADRLGPSPTLTEVRAAVIEVRRGKSMVIDPTDANHRSAGSFFLNPVVPSDAIDAIAKRVAAAGHDPARMPRWPAGDDAIKLSAAWLIERAGLQRGHGIGRVGLSTRHTLALVNRGGARADEVIAFAADVRATVQRAFGVTLHPEPVLVGFDAHWPAVLDAAAR